jgi:uncharacterized repeat protein (TIGR01451 family)
MNRKGTFKWGLLLITLLIMLSANNVTAQPPETTYQTLGSFEQLLRDQHNLLVSFDDLMGQTPVTREQKIEFLYSIEDLYRRQAVGMDKFSIWINENWASLTPSEKANVTASLEDLLRRQAKNLDAFNGNLLAWVKTFDPVYRQKFSDSFEDLLHRQVALLKNFEAVLHKDGMQTPLFLASFEDLLRRQAQSLEGFGDLGEYTFDTTLPQEGAGIAIYKTANRTSLQCGEPINYKYTVYNNGDQNVTDIVVTDLNLPGGPIVGTIPMLEVYQSKSINRTVTYDCSRDVVYPIKVCNNATAKGTASSGEAVQAESNEVCVILNGPQAEVNCDPIQGHEGHPITVQGTISRCADGGGLILSADDGNGYNLFDNDDDAWEVVQRIFANKECARISGCVYEGLSTTCQATDLSIFVNSCEQINCPGCPDITELDGQIHHGLEVTLTGAITQTAEGCYVLTDTSGVKYELEEDGNYPDAWQAVLGIPNGLCAEIIGCAYKDMKPVCGDSDGVPVYVRSCEETNCAGSNCPPIVINNQIHQGKEADLIGKIMELFDGGCFVLTDPNTNEFLCELMPDDPDAWKEVLALWQKEGVCAEITGCIYDGLPHDDRCGIDSSTPTMYVKSCVQISCPKPSEPPCTPMTNEKGETISGVLATKVGPLGGSATSCPFILYYSYQENPNGLTETKKYWLTVDGTNSQYQTEYNKLLNHGKGDYVKVYGCIYEGLESPCEGVPDAIPMYVRSVEVYPTCTDTEQVPFIDRGTIVQDTGCVIFSSATGHGKLELNEDPGYQDAWNIVEDLIDTSKLVEIYGCENTTTGSCGLQTWQVRAAVPLVGAMVVNPQSTPDETPNSTTECETCKGLN